MKRPSHNKNPTQLKTIKNKFNKNLLIVLRKTFWLCADRVILKNKISNDNNIEQLNKLLLNNIVTIYDSVWK